MNQPLSCAVAWVMRGTWTKVSEADAVLRSEDHTQKLTDKRAILVTLIWKVSKIASFLSLFLPYIFFHTCLHFPHPFVSFIFTKTVCVTRNKNGLGSSLLVKLRQHFILFYFIRTCLTALSTCMSVYHICVWCFQMLDEGVISLEPIVMSHHLGCGKQSGYFTRATPVLNAEPSFFISGRGIHSVYLPMSILFFYSFWSFT